MNRVALPWTLAALLLIPPSAAAAEPDFNEVIDVRVVNLEVVVTAQGKRISGLGPEDFRLEVDGEQIPIEYFTEVHQGRAITGTTITGTTITGTTLADDSQSTVDALPAFAPGEAVGTRYLIFLDDDFAIPAYRNRQLGELETQLDFLRPQDTMALVAFDGQQVTMLSNWTSSKSALRDALKTAAERPTFGLRRLAELREYDAQGRYAQREIGGETTEPGDDATADPTADLDRGEDLDGRLTPLVKAASATLRAFAKPPGRKVMLLYSGGWSILDPPRSLSAVEAAERLFQPVVDTANRLGYTLYPIDLNNDLRTDYSDPELATDEDAAFQNIRVGNRNELEELTLTFLSTDTGGEAYLDGGAHNAFKDTAEDTSSYYWLGFTPTWPADDRTHQLDVNILKPGHKVRTRKSYTDLSRAEETTMQLEGAQLLDAPLPGDDLEVTLGDPTQASRRTVQMTIQVKIPLDQITLLEDSQGNVAKLELRVTATDQRGERAPVQVVPFEIRGRGTPPPGTKANYEVRLELRDNTRQLLISVHDPASGHTMSKRVEISL